MVGDSLKNLVGGKNNEKINQDLHLGLYLGHDTDLALIDGNGCPVLIAEESKFCGYKSPFFHPVWALQTLQSMQIKHIKTLSWAIMKDTPTGCRLEWFFKHLETIANRLRDYLGEFMEWEKEIYISHHEAHAESAFWPSSFEKALILTIDGSGEDESLSLFLGDKKTNLPLKKVEELKANIFSYGHFYDMITSYLGYRNGRAADHCGKIMGLSSYGKPRYVNYFYKFYKTFKDKTFPQWGSGFGQKLIETLGPPHLNPKTEWNQKQADIASSAQCFLENEILDLLKSWRRKYPEYSHLYLAGGVAMNSLMNGKILDAGIFDDIFVQPMASDCGLAFGAAIHGARTFKDQNNNKFNSTWKHAYHGFKHNYIEKELQDILNIYELPIKIEKKNISPEEIAQRLIKGKIVSVFQKAQEVGARALGNRSILTLPTGELRDKVNRLVKYREPWRPFAPIVIESKTECIFGKKRPEPFMTIIYDVKSEYHYMLDGITHIDGTARLQTVNKSQNEWFYQLLNSLKKYNLEPILLNTSLNINGQPIVRTVYDAIITFLSSGIEDLIIENNLLTKKSEEIWPRSSVCSLDRMLEPILRNCDNMDVFMLHPSLAALEDLKKLINLPCIKNRSEACQLVLKNFYSSASNRSFAWEALALASKHFVNVYYSEIPKEKPKRNSSLIILTGNENLIERKLKYGEISEASSANFSGIKSIFDNTGSDRVFVLDHSMHLLPLKYYLRVVLKKQKPDEEYKVVNF